MCLPLSLSAGIEAVYRQAQHLFDASHLAGPLGHRQGGGRAHLGALHPDISTFHHLQPQTALCGYTDVMFTC